MRTTLVLGLCILMQARPAPLPEYYKSVDSLTWVVRDLDKAVAGWTRLGFAVRETSATRISDVTFRGNPSACKARFASGRLGDVQINWIQPLGGNNAYTEFLERHGSGVFSVVHRVPARQDIQAEIKRMAGLGIAVLQAESVQSESGAEARTYFDTEPDGKYVLGLCYDTKGGGTALLASGDRKVVQYAFVVRRLEPVLEFWDKLGFTAHDTTHPPLFDLRYHDQNGHFDAELGWQRHGRVPYEWILPLKGPTVYLDHMDKHGEGIHHLAFEVPDLDREVERWQKLGFPFIQGGAWGEKGKPGWGRFAYQDTDAIGGTAVELLWNSR